MLMQNIVVLKHVAQILNEPVYIFGDDIKDYFNHFVNAPEESWKLNTIFLDDHDLEAEGDFKDARGNQINFVHEKRMGFGLHPNSNIAIAET